MMAVMLRLTLMSLIVGNSFKFTILVQISADTIRIVYEMRPCADIPSGWHPVNTVFFSLYLYVIECQGKYAPLLGACSSLLELSRFFGSRDVFL